MPTLGGMWSFRTRKPKNAWIDHDRSERGKLIAATLGLFAIVLFGLGLLVFALAH